CQSLYSSKTKNDKGNYDGEWNDFIDIKPHPDTARIHAYTVNTTWGLDYKGIDCSTLNLTTGESYQLKLADGSTTALTDLNFDTSEASVATVSADGKISAKGAGVALITVTDKKDEAKYQFINVNVQTDFSDAKVSFKDGVSSFTYTGKAIEPEVVVTVRDKELVKDTDYEVSYKNNINALSPSVVIVTGTGRYKDFGSKRLSFTIEKKDLASEDIKLQLECKKINYTGKERKPLPYVKDGEDDLKNGKDYDVSYSNNTEISTGSETKPTVTLTGKGNYFGTITDTFEIEKAPFALWVEGAEDSKYFAETFTYTSAKIEPTDMEVYWYNTKLTEGKDYTLKYVNNVNAYNIDKSDKNDKKAPAIIISGKGDYSGNSIRVLFTISPTTLDNCLFSNIFLQYKEGKVQKGKTKVSFVSDYENLCVLKENKDYKLDYDKAYAVDKDGNKIEDFKGKLLSDIGTYYIPIKGIGNFESDDGKGYIKEYIQEEKESPASLNISKAKFSFEDGSETITKNWSGKWKYMTLADDNYKLTYVKDGKEVTLKEYKEGETLSDCDYIVSYKNNNKAGKASIIFTGINDYSGKLTKTFTITKGKLGEKDSTGGVYKIAGVDASYIYLKNGVYPEFKVNYTTEDGTYYTLMEGRDYTVKYKNNKELCDEKKLEDESAKLPSIIVTGKGNFEGTLKEIFAITASDLSRLSGYGYATDIKYANKPFSKLKKPSVFIYDLDGKALKAGTDYEKEVEYYYSEGTEVTVYGREEKVTRAAG
ncbi:MAG: Ig-like domain-containing protein, partial [Lachnospiraceae bacterium]|nr:Ig-like domain-containing protein [Lachnospiraceae bacterium]